MRRRGLTLVELMLAFGVAALSVLTVFQMITAGLAHYRKLDVIGVTQSLAEAKMEEVVASDVAVLAPSSGDFPAPHQEYHYEVTVVPQAPPEVKAVTVTVRHSGGTRRTLATLRAPNQTPKGMQLFFSYGCNNCHSVTGVATAPVGLAPDLTNAYLKSETYLKDSITTPNQDVDPLYAIDADGDGAVDDSPMEGSIPYIPPDEVQDLSDWLKSLDPGP